MFKKYAGALIVALALLTLVPVSSAETNLLIAPFGEAADDEFGFSVSSAGDVNSDGFSDVIVGAPDHDPAGLTDAGRAYIFFGGTAMDSIADVILDGGVAIDYLASVSLQLAMLTVTAFLM